MTTHTEQDAPDTMAKASEVLEEIKGIGGVLIEHKKHVDDLSKRMEKAAKDANESVSEVSTALGEQKTQIGDLLEKYQKLNDDIDEIRKREQFAAAGGATNDNLDMRKLALEWKNIKACTIGEEKTFTEADIDQKDIDALQEAQAFYDGLMFAPVDDTIYLRSMQGDISAIIDELSVPVEGHMQQKAAVGAHLGNAWNMPPHRLNEVVRIISEYSGFSSLVDTVQVPRNTVQYRIEHEEEIPEDIRRICGDECGFHHYATMLPHDVQTVALYHMDVAFCADRFSVQDMPGELARMDRNIAWQVGRKLDQLISFGTGNGEMMGFMRSGMHRVETSGHTSAYGPSLENYNPDGIATWQDLLWMHNNIDSHYRARGTWALEKSFAGHTFTMSDTQGRPIWSNAILSNGDIPRIAGRPFQIMTLMEKYIGPDGKPVLGGHPVAFGDWKQFYRVYRRGGIQVIRDIFSKKPCIEYYYWLTVGGAVKNPAAVMFLEIVPNATNNP